VFFNVNFANTYRYLSFRLAPGKLGAPIESIQRKWASLLPGSSFEYRFMDDTLSELYAKEIQMKKAAYTASGLALVIMLLGVTGLIALNIQQREKEISIRKVLGASVPAVMLLFIKEFMIMLLLAAAIAIPAASWIMNGWLQQYAYRITLTGTPFLLAVTGLALLTFLLIAAQTIKAALANPVKGLRPE